MFALLLAAALHTAAPQPIAHDLVLSSVGRFAVFADRASLQREGDVVTIRALQVVEPGFEAGGRAYAGGWSHWRFDCAARTGDRLDFASLAEDGTEGPATPDSTPPAPVSPGGDMGDLFDIACGGAAADDEGVATAAAAVSLGRARLAELDGPGPTD
ncbi:MAG: surface-adhesin E family protein [Brevundimonas sp.]|uniref:surface-adhesin E family protein n=1 Tax=Brevundimonas sp. TaxID=1871086 RepID=UPI00391C75AD